MRLHKYSHRSVKEIESEREIQRFRMPDASVDWYFYFSVFFRPFGQKQIKIPKNNNQCNHQRRRREIKWNCFDATNCFWRGAVAKVHLEFSINRTSNFLKYTIYFIQVLTISAKMLRNSSRFDDLNEFFFWKIEMNFLTLQIPHIRITKLNWSSNGQICGDKWYHLLFP